MPTDNRKTNEKRIGLVIALLAFSILSIAVNVQANLLDDIAEVFDNKIFDGQDLVGAKMLLSLAVIISVVLALAIAEFNVIGMSMTLMALIGFFTYIGWLQTWLIIIAVIIFSAFFGKRIVVAITRGDTAED